MDVPNPNKPMLCAGCRYPLSPNATLQCPECGQRFDPEDPDTYTTPVRSMRFPGETLVAPIAVLVVGVAVGFDDPRDGMPLEFAAIAAPVALYCSIVAIVRFGTASRVTGALSLVAFGIIGWEFFRSPRGIAVLQGLGRLLH